MRITLSKKRRQGWILLLLVLLCLFLIFIGTLVWVIWKAINNLPQRPSGAEITEAIEEARVDVLSDNQEAYPGSNITVSAGSSWQEWGQGEEEPTLRFTPFPQNLNPYEIVVMRSTNLLYWEPVARLAPEEGYTDTNAPAGMAFYKMVMP